MLDAVELARERSKPLEQIAKDLGISSSCLWNWAKQAAIDRGDCEGLTTEERAEHALTPLDTGFATIARHAQSDDHVDSSTLTMLYLPLLGMMGSSLASPPGGRPMFPFIAERSNRRCEGQRGAAVVEFALVLPILVMLVFGIVEFSIAYNNEQGLQAAAREGARVASLPQTTNSDVISRVQSSLLGVLSPSDIQAATITVSPSGTQPCDGAPPGTHVVVTVTAKDNLDVPLLPSKLLTLTGRGEFLCE